MRPAVGFLMLLGWFGATASAADQAARTLPNVLLITIDALRFDHLGCYGYQRQTSPQIDRIAAAGARFENAQTQIPRTTQSLASLMTGVYPRRHGVLHLEDQLNERFLTLAEAFLAVGYQTGAFVNHPMELLKKTGANLGQGFTAAVRAGRLNDAAIPWLEQHARTPFFAWLHYFEPHWLYTPLPRFDLFSSPDYRTPESKQHWERLMKQPKGRTIYQNNWAEQDRAQAVALYDGEIRQADAAISEVIAKLEKLEVLPQTLVIITADHGEALGEHDYYYDHGEMLYQGVCRVPLIIQGPGIKSGKLLTKRVRLFDLFPTLLALAGIDQPSDIDAKSFARMLGAKGKRWKKADQTVINESDVSRFPENPRHYLPGEQGRWQSIEYGKYKLIMIPHPEGPEYELYQTRKDPEELRNLAAKKPKKVRRLSERLLTWKTLIAGSNSTAKSAEQPAAELQEQLRELGYVN